MQSKATTLIIIALISIFILTAWTDQQPEPANPNLVKVTGSAEVRVPPDEVILTLGVETWDEALNNAKTENDRKVNNVLSIAKRYGIEPRHIQTEHISIMPRYESTYPRSQVNGFFARKTVVITLKDISKFEDLLTDVLKADVNYVHGIDFRTTELRQYKDQARDLAVKAAKEKAEALAQALGEEVGKPQLIQEEQDYWRSGYGAWWGSYYGGGSGSGMAQNVIQEVGANTLDPDTSLAPGQITVNARVTVHFGLE